MTTTEAAATVASMVPAEVAVTETVPCASATVSAMSASTLAPPSLSRVGWSSLLLSESTVFHLPMMFCAPERPIATGTLAMPAPPPPADRATTVALISWLLVAATRRPAPLVTLLSAVCPSAFSIAARVLVVMMLSAPAPPPATWTLAMPAPPMLTEAAVAIASIVPPLSASTERLPEVVVMPVSALRIAASTTLPMMLLACETETVTPTLATPAPLPAMPDEPTMAVILEVSFAESAICDARIPEAPSPSMKARVATPMRLVEPTPAPATLTPAAPPPWIDAETAATADRIVWFEVAVTSSALSESTLVLLR
ncbi:hypothetical protein GCM10008965_16640 [Methylorubrum aminovorans]